MQKRGHSAVRPGTTGFSGDKRADRERTYVLLALRPEWYRRIREGTKKYEFRRSYRKEPTTAFIYVSAPIQAVCGAAEFGLPVVASPAAIGEIAARQRQDDRSIVLEYMSGLEKGFAIPIHTFTEIEKLSLSEIREQVAGFRPPQSYVILNKKPSLLALLLGRSALVDAEGAYSAFGCSSLSMTSCPGPT